jgi:D-serine deaminase-like pyridoxal phosphate-dependent protein
MPIELADLQTPALVLRLDRVRANLRLMAAHLNGDLGRWRPHVKTTKVPEVLDLLLEAGVRRFKCATTREAGVLLSRARSPVDLLVAFPHHGANLARLASLQRELAGHRVSVLTENPEHARHVRAAARDLGLFLDLDPGYGRTGIPLSDRARIRATVAAAGDALAGLHFYDGHITAAAPDERAQHAHAVYAQLLDLADEIGCGALELVTSGTPTFLHALAHPGLAARNHTVSPGTVVYSDVRTEELGLGGFARAAHVLTSVVSAPRADRVTCDAGSKAVDAAAGDPCAVVEAWPGLRALTPSEEHLPLQVVHGPAPAPGTLLELAPRHVCPTVNLADEAVLMDGDAITAIVPVTARGHETWVR